MSKSPKRQPIVRALRFVAPVSEFRDTAGGIVGYCPSTKCTSSVYSLRFDEPRHKWACSECRQSGDSLESFASFCWNISKTDARKQLKSMFGDLQPVANVALIKREEREAKERERIKAQRDKERREQIKRESERLQREAEAMAAGAGL